MEYKYTIDPSAEKPIMLINDVIGGEGIDGGDFQRELLMLDTMNKHSIEIMINSTGGSVLDGFSIASAILNCKTPIITNNVGIAGSIAGVIFMCGKERIMSDYGLLMMHNVSGGNDKARAELNNSISLLLSKNSSLSQDQVKKLMKIETWMNYEESIKNGFCNTEFTPIMDSVVFTEKYAYNEIFDYANIIINNINMKKEKTEIKDVEVENTAIEEVSTLEEVSIEAEQEVEVTNEVVIDAEPEIDYKNLVDEKDILIKQLQTEIANMKNAEKEKEINNFINQHIELGKISTDTKDSWFNLCKTDFDNAKEVIKSLNINKEAPKFENNINGDTKKTPQSFLEMMNFGKRK